MPRGKFALTNQKHYPDLSSKRHQYGVSALVPQTSFCGETRGGLAISGMIPRYFSRAVSGFDQKPARGFRLRPKTCRSAADPETSPPHSIKTFATQSTGLTIGNSVNFVKGLNPGVISKVG